jgi:hypothetical protein
MLLYLLLPIQKSGLKTLNSTRPIPKLSSRIQRYNKLNIPAQDSRLSVLFFKRIGAIKGERVVFYRVSNYYSASSGW